MQGMAGVIETVRLWGTTAFSGGIFMLLLFYGRPLFTMWVEAKRIGMEEKAADREADRKLDEQRNSLTFDLLSAARREVQELIEEIKRLRPLEIHAIHLQEALLHIEALLRAVDNIGMLEEAERDARAFLNRIRRVEEATGVWAGEAQRLSSTIEVSARKMPGEDEGRAEE